MSEEGTPILWNEGPAMPPEHEVFRSIVASNGNVIAMRIPSQATAALIVKAVNRDDAYDSLVEALEKARLDLRDYGAAPIQQVCEEMKRALDEAKP